MSKELEPISGDKPGEITLALREVLNVFLRSGVELSPHAMVWALAYVLDVRAREKKEP